jgi:hypothetical protein
MGGKHGTKRLLGKRRPFPSWMREVDWPNDALNFKHQGAVAKRVEIATRLLAYLMFPPPTLARPGGNPGARDPITKKVAASKRKRAKLKAAQETTYEQLKTYIAFELAKQLAAYERIGIHRMADAEEYNEAYLDFRILEGFSRILGQAGNLLARPSIKSGEWMQMMGAFCAYDLFARLGDVDSEGSLRSEGISKFVVLLRQNELGLSISHATLSKACLRYRSVAHLLVGLFGAMCGRQHRDDWIKSQMKITPTLDHLASMFGEHLREGLVRSVQLEKVFSGKKIHKRGGPLVNAEYQVKLPEDLQVGRWKRSASLVSEEERNIIDALDAEPGTVRRGEKVNGHVKVYELSSSNARFKKEALLKRWRTSSAARGTR